MRKIPYTFWFRTEQQNMQVCVPLSKHPSRACSSLRDVAQRRWNGFRTRNKFPFFQVLEFELERLGLFTCNSQNTRHWWFVGDDKSMMLCNKCDIIGTNHDRTVVHIRRRDSEQSTFGVGDKDASESFVVVPMLVRIDLRTDGKPGKILH